VEPKSDFCHPPLQVSAASLEEHFRSDRAAARHPLRNPHREARVDAATVERAVPAAVLIPIVTGNAALEVLLTRRHDDISFGGHICFPGGRRDPTDTNLEQTALRETQEEIGLDPTVVRVIGQLGDYVTHSGFRIRPVVGLVERPLRLVARRGEVEEILYFPLAALFDSSSYRLRGDSTRAHFFVEHRGAIVAGPTVSLLMGLYEELLHTHPAGVDRNVS
jgi:8-oxo-dGTP pyrophosphatase MutT (NUDIX family)